MINIAVILGDLQPWVLDSLIKKGIELLVSLICWWGKRPRLRRPKRTMKGYWECLTEPFIREVFNSHILKNFQQVTGKAGGIESK